MLAALIRQWGYLAILLGATVEGEATAVSAGAMSHKGLLELPWAALAVFTATLLADQTLFLLGRRYGEQFLAKRPKLARHSARVERFLSRYGSAFVISLRFLYGLRTASVLWLGASKFSHRRFVLLDTLGAAIWTCAMLAVGWGLGATLKVALGRAGRAEELLALALMVALATWLVIRARRRDAAARAAE